MMRLNTTFLLATLLVFSISSNANDYRREDRCVNGSFLTGALLTLVSMAGVIASFRPDYYNTEPDCPTSDPTYCCDPKGPGQNATTTPTNCVPSNGASCNNSQVLYCSGSNWPAGTKYKSWVVPVGATSAAVMGVSFFVMTGACWYACSNGVWCL